MPIITEDLLWRSVVEDRHRAPAPPDFRQVLQQDGFPGMTTNPA
jgi:hypothetical protein